MRTLQKFALWAATGIVLSVTALALSNQPGKPSPIPGATPETVSLVKDIAARFASVAVYDVNKDGQLDAAEQVAVAQAIAEGRLKLTQAGKSLTAGPLKSPGGAQSPKPALVASLLANFYASVAVYDVNQDGRLDSAEQAVVVRAITDGALQQEQPPDAPAEHQPRKSEQAPEPSESAPVSLRPVEMFAKSAAPDIYICGHPGAPVATTFNRGRRQS